MNALRAIILTALLLCGPGLARATVIMGPGGASCGTWASDRQRDQSRSQLNQAWVLGYVTAYNLYKPPQEGMAKPVDSRGIMLWIDNYCDANPQKDISDAARALIESLTERGQ